MMTWFLMFILLLPVMAEVPAPLPDKTIHDFIRPEDAGALEELDHLLHDDHDHGHSHSEDKSVTGSTKALRAGMMEGENFLFFYDISLMVEDLRYRLLGQVLILFTLGVILWKRKGSNVSCN